MKDIMTHNGYVGSVRYSEEDEVFHGKLEGIDALVTYEGQTVKELKKAFYDAVDDYLEHCKTMKRAPKKPFRGSFNVRVSPEIHRKAAVKAAMKGISLNQLVQKAIEKEVVA
jgi:predicted HicB family RNase H-like nuclease